LNNTVVIAPFLEKWKRTNSNCQEGKKKRRNKV